MEALKTHNWDGGIKTQDENVFALSGHYHSVQIMILIGTRQLVSAEILRTIISCD